MMIQGRTISPGKAEGEVLVINDAFSFLGGVDASTGELKVSPGGNIAGKVLVFPGGKGSTVGSFVMYDLKVHGKAPAAVINSSAETIVTTGAVISSIPMVDRVDVALFRSGDIVKVDADKGTVEIEGVTVTDSVSSVILIDGRILMLRRPEGASSYPGRWSLCAGKIEAGEDPGGRKVPAGAHTLIDMPITISLPETSQALTDSPPGLSVKTSFLDLTSPDMCSFQDETDLSRSSSAFISQFM